MTKTLRKHNFNFGDDVIDYTSDYQRGYGAIDNNSYLSAGKAREHMIELKKDLRKTHFSFGNDKTNYVSDTQSALRGPSLGSDGNSYNRANEVQKNIARAKQMKQELQKTSYVIGDDEEYA